MALTPNQMIKRTHTLFAVYEWSDRDPDVEVYALGGLHYRPVGAEKPSTIAADHYAQQRFYAALQRLIGSERGYSEAVHMILDLANIGHRLQSGHPAIYDMLAAELAERKAPR
jgi:hypothetical protein